MASQEGLVNAARDWIVKSHKAYDSFDIEAMEKLFTEDAVLSFAGGEEIKGRENIKNFFIQSFTPLINMTHHLKRIDVIENRIYQQTDITYTFANDEKNGFTTPLKIKALAVAWFEEEGEWEKRKDMVRFEVFLDPSGMLERIGGA